MIDFYAQEMVKFSRYIVAKFFELLPKNPVLLAELVVWKTSGDCYEIVEGYGSLPLRYVIVLLTSLEWPRLYAYFDKCAFVLPGLHCTPKKRDLFYPNLDRISPWKKVMIIPMYTVERLYRYQSLPVPSIRTIQKATVTQKKCCLSSFISWTTLPWVSWQVTENSVLFNVWYRKIQKRNISSSFTVLGALDVQTWQWILEDKIRKFLVWSCRGSCLGAYGIPTRRSPKIVIWPCLMCLTNYSGIERHLWSIKTKDCQKARVSAAMMREKPQVTTRTITAKDTTVWFITVTATQAESVRLSWRNTLHVWLLPGQALSCGIHVDLTKKQCFSM